MTKDLIVNIKGLKVSVTGQRKLVICIGIPVRESISPIFFETMLLRMEEWSQIFEIVPVIETSIPIDEARNNIIKTAKRNKFDYTFFIDSDTLIKKGQLERLLSHQKDAITGISYMRAPPYYTLIRKRVGHGLYSPIELSLSDTDLIKIDGAGFGCFLVKMSVIEKMEYPWFRFNFYKYRDEWRGIGEDLFFCEKLQEDKIDIYCDPTVQCIHIGTDVTIEMANMFKDLRLSILEEAKITREELSEFTNLSQEEVTNRCSIATDTIAKQYEHYISYSDNPKDFYKNNKDYIFELVNWHMHGRRTFDINIVQDIKNKYPLPKKILDFGSGCGQNAIELAKVGYDVYMTDFDCYTSKFAIFRAKKRKLDIKFYDIEMPIDDKFDIVLALNVLEYIPDSEFEKTIYLLKSLKKDGGKILTTVSFDDQDRLYPMRYKESKMKIELIKQLNENNNN